MLMPLLLAQRLQALRLDTALHGLPNYCLPWSRCGMPFCIAVVEEERSLTIVLVRGGSVQAHAKTAGCGWLLGVQMAGYHYILLFLCILGCVVLMRF